MKTKVSLRTISICLLVLCVAGAVSRFSIGVHAQNPDKTKTAHQVSPTKPDIKSDATANNAAYAAKVKEYTTESYFMTELVDHLPAFFFQAEDGIRDLTVTGVQTCALPI